MPSEEPPSTEGIPGSLLYQGLFAHSLHEVHVWKVVRDEGGEIVTWRLVDANPVALAAWGRSLPEVVGKTTDEIFEGFPATEAFLPIVQEIFETGRPREWKVEFPPTREILHMVSAPFGEHFLSTGVDVSQFVRQSRALDGALRKLEQAVRAGGVGLWDWDLATDEVHYSDEWKRQLGYGPDELRGGYAEWERRLHPDDAEHAVAAVRRAIATRATELENAFRLRHRDGSYRWILARSSLVLDDEGQPVRMLGSHTDITERKRLEERALAAEKLEAMGTLAAGIAHDFNNLLAAITGNLSVLRESVPEGSDDGELLGEVTQAADAARGLTARLLTFAKGSPPVREAASLEALIRDCASISTRGSNVRCEVRIDPGLATVEVDVVQIGQVMQNLILNAVQAMSGGGVVRVRASNAQLGPGNSVGLSPGRYVEVTVADRGPGIPPEALHRVFDPFFTTKAGGTGLGLATANSIVSRHGGRLTVTSEAGQGATFHVHLPASSGPNA